MLLVQNSIRKLLLSLPCFNTLYVVGSKFKKRFKQKKYYVSIHYMLLVQNISALLKISLTPCFNTLYVVGSTV